MVSSHFPRVWILCISVEFQHELSGLSVWWVVSLCVRRWPSRSACRASLSLQSGVFPQL